MIIYITLPISTSIGEERWAMREDQI